MNRSMRFRASIWRSLWLTCLFLGFMSPTIVNAEAGNLEFGDFPAQGQTWRYPEHINNIEYMPDWEAADIRDILERGTNFAGSAAFISMRCGTGCALGTIYDSRTDVWYDIPFAVLRDFDAEPEDLLFEFKPESTLLVVRGWRDDLDFGTFLYHWTGYDLIAVLDPFEPDFRNHREEIAQGNSLLDRGDAEASLMHYFQALAKAGSVSERVTALASIGIVYRDMGEFSAAGRYISRVLYLRPRNEWAQEVLAGLPTSDAVSEEKDATSGSPAGMRAHQGQDAVSSHTSLSEPDTETGKDPGGIRQGPGGIDASEAAVRLEPLAEPVCEPVLITPSVKASAHHVAYDADGRPEVLWTEILPADRLARLSPVVAGIPAANGGHVNSAEIVLLRDQTLRYVSTWAGTIRPPGGHRDPALGFIDHASPERRGIEFLAPPPGSVGRHAHRNTDGSVTLIISFGGRSGREPVSLRAGENGGWRVDNILPTGYPGNVGRVFGASHPNGNISIIWGEPFAEGASSDRPLIFMTTWDMRSDSWGDVIRVSATGSDPVRITDQTFGAYGLEDGLLLWWSHVGAPLRVVRVGADGAAIGPVMQPEGDHSLLASGASPSGDVLFVLENRSGENSWVRVSDGMMSPPEQIERLEMKAAYGYPQLEATQSGDFWLVQRHWALNRILRFDSRSASWSDEVRINTQPPADDPTHDSSVSRGLASVLPDGSLTMVSDQKRRDGSGEDFRVDICR